MVRISDIELVRILMENSRTPFIEIARRLGVSEATVRKRVRKLEREGVIRKYTVDVDPRRLGFEVRVIIGVDTRPESYLSVLRRLKEMREVVSLYSCTGDHMALAECWFRNSGELAEFVRMLESMEGVTRVCPAIIIERIK